MSSILTALRKFLLARVHGTASQEGQDLWVARFVAGPSLSGYFVDVGAYDGIHASNTLLLEHRHGWTGLCIEANPFLFQRLKASRHCRCIHAAASNLPGELLFHCEGVLGRVVDAAEQAKLAAGASIVRVQSLPLAAILDAHGAPPLIDYLSVDVEGHEDQVLLGFPFERFQFRALTIERPSAALQQILAAHSYTKVQELPDGDSFYVHRSMLSQYCQRAMARWNPLLLKSYGLVERLDRFARR